MAISEDPISLERLERCFSPSARPRGSPKRGLRRRRAFSAAERDQVLGRTWAGLAFSDALPERPYALPVDFMGLPLLITRDRTGTLRCVFTMLCSHRGIKLVAEPTEVQGVINCRYHCWAYSVNGDLKATPHIGGVNRHTAEGFDNAEHGLKAVRSGASSWA